MKNMNRRHFLAATSTALTFPFVGRVLGANAKLNIGVVGVAARAKEARMFDERGRVGD